MGIVMADEDQDKRGWSAAEQAALRKLIRMGLIMLLAIGAAGLVAALLSAALDSGLL